MSERRNEPCRRCGAFYYELRCIAGGTTQGVLECADCATELEPIMLDEPCAQCGHGFHAHTGGRDSPRCSVVTAPDYRAPVRSWLCGCPAFARRV